jgi:metallo-beta-lactamase class B
MTYSGDLRWRMINRLLSAAFLLLTVTTVLAAQINPKWKTNHAPFRIAGNLYYVGSEDLASYLITTSQGNILINSNLRSSVPQIRANVESLGFRFKDVKILLISHAHSDHDEGSAAIIRATGARYEVMEPDVSVVESGGQTDFLYGGRKGDSYEPAKVERALHDGDEVRLGETVLVAHLTPGHTKGCTTWTMKVEDGEHIYNVVIVGSPNVNPGVKLVGNTMYPQIAADYALGFRTLRSLPCDIFLGAHGSYFDMEAKYDRITEGEANPFVDPQGYRSYVDERERAFRKKLATQMAVR